MKELKAKQVKKDRANGLYSIHARMALNDLVTRKGCDSVHDFVSRFNETMSYLPKRNAVSCDMSYKAVMNDEWTEAKVLKLHPGSTKDPDVLWLITREEVHNGS